MTLDLFPLSETKTNNGHLWKSDKQNHLPFRELTSGLGDETKDISFAFERGDFWGQRIYLLASKDGTFESKTYIFF